MTLGIDVLTLLLSLLVGIILVAGLIDLVGKEQVDSSNLDWAQVGPGGLALIIIPIVSGLTCLTTGLLRRRATGRSHSGQPLASRESGREDIVGAMERLAILHRDGSLTDAEFASAKAAAIEASRPRPDRD